MSDPQPLSSPHAGYSCGPVGFFDAAHIDPSHDVRGLLCVWELPRRDATYILGCDPTVGIPMWTPSTATADDRRTDNAAIEVVRKGGIVTKEYIDPKTGKKAVSHVRERDVQVAEFAAPIDPITLAAVINAIGKLYRGDAEDDGCLVIHEAYPGPGLAVTPELYSRFGYTNLWIQGYLDSPKQKRSIEYGWTTSYQSKQLLWTKTTRHLHMNGVRIHSPYLLEELVDDSTERFVGIRRSNTYESGPMHDDRSMALRLALWACVPPTARVHMADGTFVQMRDLRIGDWVRGRRGPESVCAIYTQPKNETMRSLYVSGFYRPLRCTLDHRILVQRQRGHTWTKNRVTVGTELEWIAAKDVKPSQRVLVPATFDLPKTTFHADELYLMGWYLAEGHIAKNTVFLSLSHDETKEAEKLRVIADWWLLRQPRYQGAKKIIARIKKTRTSLQVYFASPMISQLFLRHMGTGSHAKRLSPELIASSGLLPLVRGWAEGDGCVCKGLFRGTTVSETLAIQLRQVLLNHGLWATVRQRHVAPRAIEGRMMPPCVSYSVNLGRPWHRALYAASQEVTDTQRVTKVPEGFLTPIRVIKDEPYSGMVYDIQTSEHSFSCEGAIIHNCHAWTMDTDQVEQTSVAPIGSTLPDAQRRLITAEGVASEDSEWWDKMTSDGI